MKSLTPKDLINVGVFTAIYFVVVFVFNFVGLLGAPMMLFGHGLAIFAGGVIMALYQARVPKFGAITLTGFLISAFMTVVGHSWYMIPVTVGLCLIGDFLRSRSNFSSPLANSIAYALFSLWFLSPLLPIVLHADEYRKKLTRAGRTTHDIESFVNFFTVNVLIIWGIAIFFIALAAGLFGENILKRHFKRAGLAR
ncbi:MAG: permease [Actinomycetales bacterium]|nr:MAG: permease [Actinomycetales bacterium]